MPRPLELASAGHYPMGMSSTAAKLLHSPHQPTGQWIRSEKRLAIYIRDNFSCLYCGASLKDAAPAEIHLDHLTPRSQGGTNDASNLVTSCRSCNCSRGNRNLEDFAPGGSLDRIAVQRWLPLNIALAKSLIAGCTGDPIAEGVR